MDDVDVIPEALAVLAIGESLKGLGKDMGWLSSQLSSQCPLFFFLSYSTESLANPNIWVIIMGSSKGCSTFLPINTVAYRTMCTAEFKKMLMN